MSDLISREDIPYIDLNGDMPQSKVRVWVAFKEQIDALPSADRPTGEWKEKIIKGDSVWTQHRYYCSVCGGWNTYGKSDYCPNCGAKMGGDSDG